jgi:hypothetical protein
MVPGSSAIKKSERHTIDRRPFKADKAGRHFQSYPLPRWRKRSHVSLAVCSFGAPGNVAGSPIGAMIPIIGRPLQHHLARHTRRIQIDVRNQDLSGADSQSIGGLREHMMMDALNNR